VAARIRGIEKFNNLELCNSSNSRTDITEFKAVYILEPSVK
jgi:hypothetical protein